MGPGKSQPDGSQKYPPGPNPRAAAESILNQTKGDMMPIQITEDGLQHPVLICDHCGERIYLVGDAPHTITPEGVAAIQRKETINLHVECKQPYLDAHGGAARWSIYGIRGYIMMFPRVSTE